jgi:hypothetical protein
MKIIEKDNLSIKEKEMLRMLWNDEYPARLNYKNSEDFDFYLNELSNTKHYLLLDDSDEINGWAFTFLRDNEDWFAIILNSQIQRKGNGTLLIEELKKKNYSLNGWAVDHDNDIKKNGKEYKSPLLFYTKNDFIVYENTRIENEKISAVKISWKNKK